MKKLFVREVISFVILVIILTTLSIMLLSY